MKTSKRTLLAAIMAAGTMMAATPSVMASDAADDVIDANVVGGTSGYLLKRLNGAVIDSRNPDFVFYPASTIKVLQHLAAMQLVEEGKMNLGMNIQICNDQNNCGDELNSSSGCTTINNTLQGALSVMMVNSGNRTTNAVQENIGRSEYLSIFSPAALGRSHMNFLGQNEIGYSGNTELNHKFACGNVNNNPSNSATLSDFAKLYEAIGSREDIISVATRLQMKDIMLNESNGYFSTIAGVIDSEANQLGKNLIADDFKDGVKMIYKAGSLPNGYLSVAGLIQLPINNGTGKRIYSFSSFIEDADIVINGTSFDISTAMLRPVIRSALQSWNKFNNPGFGYVAAQDSLGKLEAIILDLPDQGSLYKVETAIAEMSMAKDLLGRHLPDNAKTSAHLVSALSALSKISRVESEGNIEAVMADIAALSGHLAENEVATVKGESMNSRLADSLSLIEASQQMAQSSYFDGRFLTAAQQNADVIVQANALLMDNACASYAEDRVCPEHAAPEVGF